VVSLVSQDEAAESCVRYFVNVAVQVGYAASGSVFVRGEVSMKPLPAEQVTAVLPVCTIVTFASILPFAMSKLTISPSFVAVVKSPATVYVALVR
jgi:hypothetical protein